MATISVRVIPRSSRRQVESAPGGVTIRVQSPPAGGRATEEARRALAEALGLSPGRVSLRSGGRSRWKVFSVEGLSEPEIRERLERQTGRSRPKHPG